MISKCFLRTSWLPCAFILVLSACEVYRTDAEPGASAKPASPAADAIAQSPASPGAEIRGAPIQASSQTAQANAALTQEVESAIRAEPALSGSSIAISGEDGVITLTGTTRDAQLRSMAAQVALSVKGVKLVRNELAIAREA